MSKKTKSRWQKLPLKRRILFSGLLLLLLLGVLRGLDAGLGWLASTEIRHQLALQPNAEYRHKTTEFDYVYSTNSLGFRGAEISRTKPKETRRVAVIGDSFIAGLGVEYEDTLTAKLEQILNREREKGPNIQVLNRGRPGSSTIREYDLYRYYTRTYQPDIVVLGFDLGSDLADIEDEQTEADVEDWLPPGVVRKTAYTLMPNLYLELAMLKRARRENRQIEERTEAEFLSQLRAFAESRDEDPQLAEQRFQNIPKKYREMAIQAQFGNDYIIFHACVEPDRIRKALHPNDDPFQKAWPRVETHLDSMHHAIRRDGARFVILSIPDAIMVSRKAWEFYETLGYELEEQWLVEPSRTEQALADWCQQNEVPYLNLVPPFRAAEEELFYPMDGHFNAAGQHRAAQLLTEFLLTQTELARSVGEL